MRLKCSQGSSGFLRVGMPSRLLLQLLLREGALGSGSGFTSAGHSAPLLCLALLFCKHLTLVLPVSLLQNGPDVMLRVRFLP